ncbi:hypothetical protein DY000_02016271 [Brassica cretica]|uniref:Uncharacterized protein n=1 Tax=Brassica cretica TaxID=69181 RepID=A0ABQ7CR46_BRACR|nr:hypothetical protein DY000_02016271 [Brassica cretica]
MRGPAVSGPLSWSQVFPFGHVGCIFSKSVDYRDILLRPGGSGIYPPETWRFPDVGELLYCLADDLCTSGVWRNIALHTRTALPVCFYFFRLLSASHWVSHSQRFTMSLNVQAGLCFPLGEPLSAFSGRHSMTRRLFLNLLCHGHVDGRYMARKSGCKVVGTLDLEPGSWDPEPGSWNPEPRGGRAAVFLALGQGSFRGTTPMEFDEYSKAFYPPRYQAYLGFHYHLDSRT